MRIITPTEIESEDVAWEGYLEPLGETFKSGVSRPRVTLGKPKWWPAEALKAETGQDWSPPADDRRYTLLRLACTLHPPGDPRTRYTEATLDAYLAPRYGAGSVVAHDLYPQRLSADEQAKFSVGLGPDLKFAKLLEAKLFEVGAEIEYHKAFPVIQSFGLGESHPYWRFAHHAANPLQGSQFVYAVLDAPGETEDVRLSISLVATLETRYGGLIRVGSPEEVRAYVGAMVDGQNVKT